MKKEMICISCPLGCRLDVEWNTNGEIKVSGNKCPRGEVYGKEEILSPRRVLTATAPINSTWLSRLPVMTNEAVPKASIDTLLNKIYKLNLHPPINRGDVIMKNIDNTGIDLVASRTVKE